jgi:hypothetical protein
MHDQFIHVAELAERPYVVRAVQYHLPQAADFGTHVKHGNPFWIGPAADHYRASG